MVKKSRASVAGEAIAELVRATTDGLKAYDSRPVRIGDLLQEFNGSKSALAREMSGLGAGKLPARGTKERTAYDSANRQLGRWLKSETGASGQKRTANPESQAKLKSILAKKRPLAPPADMTISVSGYIGYDDDYRYRSITVSLPSRGASTKQFLEHMRAGDTKEAWQDIMQGYMGSRNVLTVEEGAEVGIDFASGFDIGGEEE